MPTRNTANALAPCSSTMLPSGAASRSAVMPLKSRPTVSGSKYLEVSHKTQWMYMYARRAGAREVQLLCVKARQACDGAAGRDKEGTGLQRFCMQPTP